MIGYGITLIILSTVVLLTIVKNNKLERRLAKTEDEVDELIERLHSTDDKLEKHIRGQRYKSGVVDGYSPEILLCDYPTKPEVSD
ncbi:hypothetical protein [Listeria rocourtiae]|uniref:hypothetical protein n=1 Tax=Listeria rocourtiae TaxID=647910 RepID=UPI003D2F917C